ncbi:uncharacterized protein [Pyrus communis]|uniref:uncharacterized protein n=1 Tax=Pyrus communis TaxID=23211 RepID=UPI0035C0A59C
MNFSSIETLNGSNYKKWKQDIEILLGLMYYDLAIREEESATLIEESTIEQKVKFEKWEKSNRMGLLIMKKAMTETFNGTTSVREHILKMVHTAGKLKELEVPISDQFLVHMALNSLPAKFGQLKVSYNTQKEK